MLLGGETLDEGPVRDAALLGCPAVVEVDEEIDLLQEVLSSGVAPIVHQQVLQVVAGEETLVEGVK